MTWFLNGYPIHTTGRASAPRCLDMIEVGPRAAVALWQNEPEPAAERLARSIAADRAARGIR